MEMNIDYRIYRPTIEAMRERFGTLDEAIRLTGGDIPTACFYIANPSYELRTGFEASTHSGEFLNELKHHAEMDLVAYSWEAQSKERRKTIAQVMRDTGLGRPKVKRILQEIKAL